MTFEHRPLVCLQADVDNWLTTTIGPSSIVEQSLSLAEEVGELCRAVLKRHQNIRGTHEQWTLELRKEIADVHLALLALAEREGIDLHTATVERFTDITTRNPHTTRLPA